MKQTKRTKKKHNFSTNFETSLSLTCVLTLFTVEKSILISCVCVCQFRKIYHPKISSQSIDRQIHLRILFVFNRLTLLFPISRIDQPFLCVYIEMMVDMFLALQLQRKILFGCFMVGFMLLYYGMRVVLQTSALRTYLSHLTNSVQYACRNFASQCNIRLIKLQYH